MWDRQDWYVARQSFKDQRRASLDARRAHRGNYYYRRRRNPFFVILFVILLVVAISNHSFFPLVPLVIIGCFVLMGLRRSMLRSNGFYGSNSNYQQPNQYYQPPQQPDQYYQPPASPQPDTPYTSPYQPYGQGYQAPQNDYQQGAQPYQGNPSQPASEQYEEPQAQYPQEMPPMM